MGRVKELSKAELIKYLTHYRNAARRHSTATAEMACLQARLDAAGQTASNHPPKGPLKSDRSELERALRTAQGRVYTAWQLYKQLDDMEILPARATYHVPALLELLKTGQAETLDEALALLERQGR